MKLKGISSYSVKRWKEEFPYLPDEKIRQLKGLASGKIKTRSFESVRDWEKQCYNSPSFNERAMCALNEIVEGSGVEAIRTPDGNYIDNYCMDIAAVYVNMGDTYDTTILLDHATGRYYVTTMGDYVERIK